MSGPQDAGSSLQKTDEIHEANDEVQGQSVDTISPLEDTPMVDGSLHRGSPLKRQLIDPPEAGVMSSPKRRREDGDIRSYFMFQPRLSRGGPSSSKPSEQDKSFETTTSPVFSQNSQGQESITTAPLSSAAFSQDFFPSQEVRDLLQDEQLQRCLQEADKDTHDISVSLMANMGNETPQDRRASQAKSFHMRDLRRTLQDSSPFNSQEFDSVQDWRNSQPSLCKESKLVSIIQSVKLKWSTSQQIRLGHQPLKLEFNQLRLQKSCRFHRRFGSHRFLVVDLPSLTARELPGVFKGHQEAVQHVISSWLSDDDHHFLGRIWRTFFIQPVKSKKLRKDKVRRLKALLFAESGHDIQETPVQEFFNRHIPIDSNLRSTDCKTFHRFTLGLTKTTPTVTLEQPEFLHLRDKIPVMNDGCARMSESLARSICNVLGIDTIPSAFQGRIAGAKGMWMVEKDDCFKGKSDRGYYLEVSDSQLKINPHPADSPHELDSIQRTFEVVKYSKLPRSSTLNLERIRILHHCGVPSYIFQNILEGDMKKSYEKLDSAANDPLLLRDWINTVRMPQRSPIDSDLGQWPINQTEQSVFLLENGFDFKFPLLVERFRNFLNDDLSRFTDDFQIRVPLSTSLFCLADPYGILEEDEVHCCFSSAWEDSSSEFRDTTLDDFDVLISRSPASLPYHVQKRKAKFRSELRHFRDTVVFSTKGSRSLASTLGGDFDGDRVWVCWDQRLVEPFQNATAPEALPSAEDCGLELQATELSSIVESATKVDFRKEMISKILQKCISFNVRPSQLGIFSLEFEKLVYDEGLGMSSNAILLTALRGHLVDAPKTGYFLPDDTGIQLLGRVSPIKRQTPAYKNSNTKVTHPGKAQNILDYLKFEVASKVRDGLLTKFHNKWGNLQNSTMKDQDLVKLWKHVFDVANEEAKRGESQLKVIIADLKQEIVLIKELWERRPRNIPVLYRRFQDICPTVKVEHRLHHRHLEEVSDISKPPYTHWSLLKASCAYYHYPHKTFAWEMAAGELCELKAREIPESKKAMLQSFYAHTKFDGKSVRQRRKKFDDTTRHFMTTKNAPVVYDSDASDASDNDENDEGDDDGIDIDIEDNDIKDQDNDDDDDDNDDKIYFSQTSTMGDMLW